MAKILIVEDERSVRQALCFELEDDGFEVNSASSLPEALNACRDLRYDMVISDLFIRQGNGLELLDLLNQDHHDLPFIAITAFPDSALAHKVRSILKDRFFVKPFLTNELKAKIHEVLKN